MKIIGYAQDRHGTDDTVIVELRMSELRLIAGNLPHQHCPGMTINVLKMDKRLRVLDQNQLTLRRVRDKLREVADSLEPLDDLVSCVPEQEPVVPNDVTGQ